MKFKLQKSHEIAKQKLIQAKLQRQAKLNENVNKLNIRIGDYVYLTNENRRKLDPAYIGPFTVVEITNTNCVIKHNQTGKTTTVHKNRLKHF